MSPQLFSAELFHKSGHYKHYREDMFLWQDGEGRELGLKPMNCPGHALMFAHRPRSYRDLPLRLAEFGVVHRNECSGALCGLRRVCKFCQDDAHIFCAPEQIKEEVAGALEFMAHVYARLGLQYELHFASRPEKAMGNDDLWASAERQLLQALEGFAGSAWHLDEGGGAFYGPKIDVKVQDAAGHWLQCASIQLDFQLPAKFGLQYAAADGSQQQPVMIHRAVLGSLERMFAVLSERYAGDWPFWLSPRQALVVPVLASSAEQRAHAQRVCKQLRIAGYAVDSDLSDRDLRQKVKEAGGHSEARRLCGYKFLLVVGDQEVAADGVNLKAAQERRGRNMSVEQVQDLFGSLLLSQPAEPAAQPLVALQRPAQQAVQKGAEENGKAVRGGVRGKKKAARNACLNVEKEESAPPSKALQHYDQEQELKQKARHKAAAAKPMHSKNVLPVPSIMLVAVLGIGVAIAMLHWY